MIVRTTSKMAIAPYVIPHTYRFSLGVSVHMIRFLEPFRVNFKEINVWIKILELDAEFS